MKNNEERPIVLAVFIAGLLIFLYIIPSGTGNSSSEGEINREIKKELNKVSKGDR